MVAVVALFDVAAQRRGPTSLDGVHGLLLRPRQGVAAAIRRAILAKDVGHFQRGPLRDGAAGQGRSQEG